MKISIIKALIVSVGICTAAAATGCSGIFGRNSRSDINHAISSVREQYGKDFKLKSKKPTGGALCNFTVTCSETGDQEISVFQYDNRSPVHTDYMFVKYGDDAYTAIRKAVEKTEEDCKVLVNDNAVNHYPNVTYDASADLAAYLADNDFVIKVMLPKKFDRDGLLAEYNRLALSLRDSGIDCDTLILMCADTKADYDKLIPPDHIPHKTEQDVPSSSASFSTSIYSVYRSLAAYCEDPDNIKDVLIEIDGEVVKKI